MTLRTRHKAFATAYNLLWTAALPLLYAGSKRLRPGFGDRLVPADWASGPTDLWIQAASVGEAYLAWDLLKALPEGRACNVLVTSCTSQGIGVIDRAVAWCRVHKPSVLVRRAYLPFDMPCRMRKALRLARPRLLVLLETELWPGMLLEAHKARVPVVVVNGRMNSRSLAGYLAAGDFFKAVSPTAVCAISEKDAQRFATLFPDATVSAMPNMKFGRILDTGPMAFDANPLSGCIAPGAPFLVLGSVRAEEEPQVRDLIFRILHERPTTIIGVFPRHMHRVEAWAGWLNASAYPWTRRSDMRLRGDVAAPGTVVLWDTIGELQAAYALARAAFVGGSLRPLGGQNFLEPLTQGLVPCIGPHWSNFSWVGREIIDAGLVKEAQNVEELADLLIKGMKRPLPPAKVIARMEKYLAPHQGGAQTACACMLRHLDAR
ncbi:MAG: 3-deoxy-D-manno-octulosonic acid transferase [Desulfovibrionaceae bacterium]